MNPRLMLKEWLERLVELLTWPGDPIRPIKAAQIGKYVRLSELASKDQRYGDKYVEIRHRLNSMEADVRIVNAHTGELMQPKGIIHINPDVLRFDLPYPCAITGLMVTATKYRGPNRVILPG
jgi:hypothetical protein